MRSRSYRAPHDDGCEFAACMCKPSSMFDWPEQRKTRPNTTQQHQAPATQHNTNQSDTEDEHNESEHDDDEHAHETYDEDADADEYD